jgi:hypothetical protein
MRFPLSISDIGLWLAVTAIILLVTSELLSSSTGPLGNVAIDKKRLRIIALALGLGFMATVVMRVFQPT